MKEYRQLPDYLSGWDVAILPFAENEATRFISPTKTLEYLAGGRPVVSTGQNVLGPHLVRDVRALEPAPAGAPRTGESRGIGRTHSS